MRKFGLLLILALLLTGCGGVSPAAPGPNPGPTTPNPGPLTKESRSGDLAAGITVTKSRLNPGETADVTIWAENRGKTPALIEGCGPGVHLVITGPGGATLPAKDKAGDRYYCEAIMDAELKPGQRLEYSFTVTIPAYPAAEPVPGGAYTFAAALKLGPVNAPPPPLTAEVQAQVTGGPETLNAKQARARAEAHPKAREWLAARPFPPEAIAGGTRWTDGDWELTWATKQGSPPHRMIVKVDARTGEVKSVQFLDR